MTRFDEVARLRELHAAAKPGPWLVYNDPSIRCPTCKTEADGRYMMALTHAHWLLEAAACFQPGDVATLGFVLSGEWNPKTCDCAECDAATQMIRRLQKAAAIMEELE